MVSTAFVLIRSNTRVLSSGLQAPFRQIDAYYAPAPAPNRRGALSDDFCLSSVCLSGVSDYEYSVRRLSDVCRVHRA